MCATLKVIRINEVEFRKYMNFFNDTTVEMFDTNSNCCYGSYDKNQIIYGNKFKW